MFRNSLPVDLVTGLDEWRVVAGADALWQQVDLEEAGHPCHTPRGVPAVKNVSTRVAVHYVLL